ncbi:protein boule-like [Periophthalmus magnuspinnatus]|uniref:protein boule-like n=1 Tax=Periophthalmus magnuspinnatus TaxID=409849 RepID=UPI00145A5113|nr:protein boule-like [Periophthalmus magnuspinnatus]
MDVNGETSVTSSGTSPVHSNYPTPEVSPSEHHSSSSDTLDHASPRQGTIIPNRIFVAGLDHKVSESYLWHIFSEYGTVTNVNIVNNRSRLTKRYGFVTFEDPEDARKLLLDVNGVYCKEKRLCIRPAFHKQHDSGNYQRPMFSMEPMPMPSGTVYLTTSGFPYTFHNGVAYFHSPRAGPNPHLWTPEIHSWFSSNFLQLNSSKTEVLLVGTPSTISKSNSFSISIHDSTVLPSPQQPAPVTVPQPWQPLYHQPTYHHQPWYSQNHYQWNNAESVGSGPVMYAQHDYLHHVPNGVSVPQPLMDNSNAENHTYTYTSFAVPPLPPAVAYSYIRNQSDQGNQSPQTGGS